MQGIEKELDSLVESDFVEDDNLESLQSEKQLLKEQAYEVEQELLEALREEENIRLELIQEETVSHIAEPCKVKHRIPRLIRTARATHDRSPLKGK